MKSSSVRPWLAGAGLLMTAPGWAVDPGVSPAAAGVSTGMIGISFAAVVLLLMGLGWWAWRWLRNARRQAEFKADLRIRQMSSLIEHAECALWEAEVVLKPQEWRWQITLHPSVFGRKLFRESLRQTGRDLWDQFHIDQRAEMDARARLAMEQGDARYVQEFRAERDGVSCWLREDVSLTRLAPDRFWLVGLVTDITAQREAEAAQRQTQLTVDRMIEQAQCLIWRATVVLEEGELKWPHFDIPPSRLSETLFGGRKFSAERGFWENLNLPERAEMDARSSQAIRSGAPGYAQQFRAIKTSGEVLWLSERVSIAQTSPTSWSLVGVLTDVTAQHAAEEAKRRSEARLSFLLELADCLVWEANVALQPDGNLHWDLYTPRSALFTRLFGEREDTHLRWEDLVVPELPAMNERLRNAVRTRASGYSQEFRVENPNETIWLREVVTMMELPGGTFRLVGVITDITAQRRAENAGRESELRLQALLDRADCMIWQGQVKRTASGEHHWTIFAPNSQLYRRLFGKESTGTTHFGWNAECVPEYREMLERCRRAIEQSLPGYEQVFRYLKPEEILWLNERVSIRRVGPDEWELIGIITDITAQRESEIARQMSEARLHELLARADCLLWEAEAVLTDDDWKWSFHIQPSGLCVKLYGSAQPPPNFGLWRSFDIPERAEMNAKCRSAMAEGRAGYEQIFRIVRPGEPVTWISENVTIRPLGDARYSLVGVAVDITALRGAEEALAAEKERLAVTLRAMSESVITTDVGGIVQFMNPAAAALTGLAESEAMGRPVAEVCRLEGNRTGEGIEVPVTRVARGDVVVELPPQTRLLTRAGTPRLVEGCCAPIHARDSHVTGTVLVLRDVTEQERLEQELVRATRLESVGVLAGGIAHDFNNILTAVMGNLTLAQLDASPGTPLAASLRSAEKAALRARDLTQQLLTFAKGGEPVRAAVRLDVIVREMTSFALHGSQVKAVFEFEPDLWPADADKGQIGRVVQNLVINAVQAMPSGGTLRVAAHNQILEPPGLPGLAPGNYLQITITDTGEGIRPEHLARIFDPYFTTKQTGTGLGLAAVYSIVKKHHGQIDVESQLGRGTTFRIWLPALREEAARYETRAPWEVDRLRGRVLFMDDEQIIRDLATGLLKRFGLEVDCAADGAEAIEKYQQRQAEGDAYDVVVMDLTIPGGMGGLAAIQRLRAIDPQVKAIVSSGYSSDPVLANYRDHGFVGMVAKPYEVTEFARVLREVLTGA